MPVKIEAAGKRRVVFCLSFIVITALTCFAQFGGLHLPFHRDEAITTSFADTKKTTAKLGTLSFDPRLFRPLLSAPRDSSGSLLLKPGAYSATVQSYCLHAGTRGPSSGEGYLYAPLKGPMAEVVESVLRNSPRHRDIAQRDIQFLIWNIEAHAKLEQYPQRILSIARQLLSPQELLKIQSAAGGLIPQSVLERSLNRLSPEAQQSLRAANRIQDLLATGSATYADIEKIAVLPAGRPGQLVPAGRWALHPGGFYIRYFPSAYTTTRLEIIVPPKSNKLQRRAGLPGGGNPLLQSVAWSHAAAQDGGADSGDAGTVSYDPSSDVAVPADTGSQRLGMSAAPAPAHVGEANLPWKEIVKEGERGGHRCADTWVLFVPPFNPEMVPQSSVKCTVEVCVPFSNSAGKVSVDMANEEVALAGTAAGQEVQQMLNADEIAPGDACEAWKSRFRTYLGNAIPGSTVSSVGTSMK